jgi:hypothetical protein
MENKKKRKRNEKLKRPLEWKHPIVIHKKEQVIFLPIYWKAFKFFDLLLKPGLPDVIKRCISSFLSIGDLTVLYETETENLELRLKSVKYGLKKFETMNEISRMIQNLQKDGNAMTLFLRKTPSAKWCKHHTSELEAMGFVVNDLVDIESYDRTARDGWDSISWEKSETACEMECEPHEGHKIVHGLNYNYKPLREYKHDVMTIRYHQDPSPSSKYGYFSDTWENGSEYEAIHFFLELTSVTRKDIWNKLINSKMKDSDDENENENENENE